MIDRRTLGMASASAALFAPRVLRAQPVTEITVHYAQPVIYKEAYDAITAEFARREPNIRINYVTTVNYEEGMQLILRQAAAGGLPDLSYQGFNRLRLFALGLRVGGRIVEERLGVGFECIGPRLDRFRVKVGQILGDDSGHTNQQAGNESGEESSAVHWRDLTTCNNCVCARVGSRHPRL